MKWLHAFLGVAYWAVVANVFWVPIEMAKRGHEFAAMTAMLLLVLAYDYMVERRTRKEIREQFQ